jgi:glycosyltransferase involved in cell wall biosynthesis
MKKISGKIRCVIKGLTQIIKPSVKEELKRAISIRAKLAVLYYVGKLSFMYPAVCSEMSKVDLPKDEPTIIYSYWLFDTADIACRLRDDGRFFSRSRAISRAHGFDVYAERNRAGYLPFQMHTVEALDGVYVCSVDGQRRLSSLYPHCADKIKVSYLGTVDHGVTDSSKDGVFRIVTCSWLAPLKRTDLLAKALKIAQKKTPCQLQWTCIGNGHLLVRYKNFADSELTDMKVVFKGALTKKEITDYYSREPVDLFVSVSESEGLPVSIMEAQSFGIPSLATDAGGTREITITGKTGTLIPIDASPEEIARYICGRATMDLSTSEKQIERSRCRKNWLENFNAEINYKIFLKDICI